MLFGFMLKENEMHDVSILTIINEVFFKKWKKKIKTKNKKKIKGN